MRPVLLALALLLSCAGPAVAAVPADLLASAPYECRQTFADYGPTGSPSWVVADRGTLALNTDYDAKADKIVTTSYDYDASFLTNQARAGGWSWTDGRAMFDSGPLARPADGWSLSGSLYRRQHRMPHDDTPGRAYPLVLRSLIDAPAEEAPATEGREGTDDAQRSFWYCGEHGVAPRTVFSGLRAYVQRASGLRVRLPQWWIPTHYGQKRETGRVRVARKGLYRVELVPAGCTSKHCSSLGIFSAKRAPASDLGHRTPVTLPGGIRGWVGSYGCAFNGTDPDWGPVYCGGPAIVWHQRGVNYCLESRSLSDADLVRAASQAVRDR